MKWKVTFADVEMGLPELRAAQRVIRSGWLTMGENTSLFEGEFAKMTGAAHAVAVSSATAALHLSYQALGLPPGGEVIMPALTFVAAANAAMNAGIRPVFADIAAEDDLNIDPAEIERRLTPKTRAVCVVHYGGYPCRLNEITAAARRLDLYLIEDCAHAPGALYAGRHVGNFGAAGCFSFFSNKNITTGEGGMVITNSPEFAAKVRLLRSHGMTAGTMDRHRGHAFSYDVVETGHNFRIDELRSAIGLVQLRRLERNNEKRRSITAAYRKELGEVEGIRIPFGKHEGKPSFHLFPILLEEAEKRLPFMQFLRDRGIQTSIHYPPIHRFTAYMTRFKVRLPVTEDVTSRLVTLPLHTKMKMKDVKSVASAIREFFRQ